MSDIYLAVDGAPHGPYTEEEIRQSLTEGLIPGDLPAWQEGLTNWIAVDSLFVFLNQAAAPQGSMEEEMVAAVEPLAASDTVEAKEKQRRYRSVEWGLAIATGVLIAGILIGAEMIHRLAREASASSDGE